MTQTPEDLEQQGNWKRGAWKMLLIVTGILLVSPMLAPVKDPFGMIRVAANKAAMGLLSTVMLCAAYVWFDYILPGSVSKTIGSDANAQSRVVCTFLACVAFMVAWG